MSVVDGAVLTQKDDVESNGGSLEIVAEIFVLSFCGVQLVLRSGVLTILDLDEADVTPSFAEVFSAHKSVRSNRRHCKAKDSAHQPTNAQTFSVSPFTRR